MRRATTQSEASAEKRERILRAGVELFVHQGYNGTSVPEIAERVGMVPSNLYRYFPSKEALVNEIYRWQRKAQAEYMLDGFPHKASAAVQFFHLWNRMVEFVADEPQGFQFTELHHHASYLDEESRLYEQRGIELARSYIKTAQERGEVKNVAPETVLALVTGAFTGVVRWSLLHPDFQPTAESWRTASELTWNAIKA